MFNQREIKAESADFQWLNKNNAFFDDNLINRSKFYSNRHIRMFKKKILISLRSIKKIKRYSVLKRSKTSAAWKKAKQILSAYELFPYQYYNMFNSFLDMLLTLFQFNTFFNAMITTN